MIHFKRESFSWAWWREANLYEFEASPVYRGYLRTARAFTQRNTILKSQTNRKMERVLCYMNYISTVF